MKPTGKTFFVSEQHKALHRSTVNLLLNTCSKAAALPCTFWSYLKPRLFEVSVLRPKANMRFWDALVSRLAGNPAGLLTNTFRSVRWVFKLEF